jgi:hypothetical protein
MNAMNSYKNLLRNIDVLAVILAIAGWVILISDNPLSVYMGMIIGVAAGLVYYFIKTKQGKIIKIPVIPSFISSIILIILFFVFIFTLFTQETGLIALNWFVIQTSDWISFIVTNAFLTFIPGFIILNAIDRESKISTMPRIVISVLLSIFLSSQLIYFAKQITLDSFSTNILFITVNFALIAIFLRIKLKKQTPIRQKYKEINVNLMLAIVFLIILSAILVYLQQFVYEAFVRGDNWNYLATSNYIDKGASSLTPVGKFYSIKSLSIYELYNLGLFSLSGFPAVNSMMITSIVIASLIPVAFFVMSSQYLRSKKITLLSTLVYIAISGFGWIPFISQKIGLGIQHYNPQELFTILAGIAPQVLNDISQPQGSIPEGFKTYVLALISIMMLLFLIKSQLSTKSRVFLIAVLTAFAFLAHIETTLAFFFAFLPAYVLLSKKKLRIVRENIVALALGILLTFVVGLSSLTTLIIPFELNYLLVAFVLGALLIYTYLKQYLKLKLPNFTNIYEFFKKSALLLICYFYFLSLIVLISYGFSHMYYGDSVVYLGFTFPWYYYPLSFGIAGALSLLGLTIKFEKYKSLSFFVLAAVLTIVLGIAVSYLNLNFFNTGTKEWRLIYRILPIATSIFGGWALFKLMVIFKKIDFHVIYRTARTENYHRIRLRRLSFVLFLSVIILGVPSTIISSEYWMTSNITPFGSAYATIENLELANFVNQNVPITSRVATTGDMSNAIIKLAGGTTAIPSIYPDFLLSSRPETIAFLSSDVGFVCIDKEIAEPSVNRDFISYLPVVLDNARFSVYSLPYLESPSHSSLGYLAPLQYSNDTLLSYLLISSLNSSYQLVNDDFYKKSIVITPSDLDINQQSAYNVKSSALLDWVRDGGTFVVMGGQGAMFNSLGLFFGGLNYHANSTANGISISSTNYPIKTLNLKPLSYRIDTDVNVLSYYSLNGSNVSPFITEKRIGNGTVYYVYVDPIYQAIETEKNGWIANNELVRIVRSALEEGGIHFPESYVGLSREPLENRWIGKYSTYGTNNFLAEGNIITNAIASGSYLIEQPIETEKLIINNNLKQTILDNKTINSITISGSANIDVQSNLCSLTGGDHNAIPSYISLKYEISSIKISVSNGSRIEIYTEDENYSINNGSILIETNSAGLVLSKPQIIVDGAITFSQISLPSDSSAWNFNVRLIGNLNFRIGYSDGTYMFMDEFLGEYDRIVQNDAIVDVIPWTAILFSLPNIFLVIGIIFLGALTFRKWKNT